MRTCKSGLHVAACLALAGCGSVPTPPPAIEARVETVNVPVAVACVDKADIPTVPAKIGGQLDGDAVRDSGILGSALADMRAVALKAVALLKGCARQGLFRYAGTAPEASIAPIPIGVVSQLQGDGSDRVKPNPAPPPCAL